MKTKGQAAPTAGHYTNAALGQRAAGSETAATTTVVDAEGAPNER